MHRPLHRVHELQSQFPKSIAVLGLQALNLSAIWKAFYRYCSFFKLSMQQNKKHFEKLRKMSTK